MQMQHGHFTQHSTDTELVNGCRQQHREAQHCLYQRFFGKMLGICMRYTAHREEAEDVLNRAFLKIFRHIGEYDEQGSLHGWMATITLRTAIDFVRAQTKYRLHISMGEVPDVPFDPDALVQLEAEHIYRLIQKLPMPCRAVFSLNILEGYTHREIGEMLGISTNTSKWHLAEAKKQLRAWLQAPSPSPADPMPLRNLVLNPVEK